MRRVVVTGRGVVSSLGFSADAAFERLRTPVNCVKVSEDLATYRGLQTRLWAPSNFQRPPEYTRKVIRTMSPVSILALNATEQALREAGLEGDPIVKSGRLGVAYGSCSGGIDACADFFSIVKDHEVRNVTSSTYIKMMPQTTAVNLSVHFGTTGRILPTGTACTSGSLAIGEAYEAIALGKQDVMIAGGAEEFSVTQVSVFDTLFATSRRNDEPQATPRAFDKNRDGLVIGDGAGTLILEQAVVLSVNLAETMAIALKLALEDADLPPSAIGYVNAHGTATDLGDIAEGTATQAVFGPGKVPISTIKGYTGHTLGACGAIEAVMTIGMMNADWYAPNLNLTEPDPRCGEHDFITGVGRAFSSDYVMSNNFAFGGVNTSLIFRRV